MSDIYGTDIVCVDDLDPYFDLVSGPEGVAQAIARRLTTPLGGLLTDPTYGFDLRALLNTSLSGSDVLAIRSAVEGQCLLDQRVDNVEVVVDVDSSGDVDVSVSPVLVEGQTFTLTFTLMTSDTYLVYQGTIWPDGSTSA